MLAAILELAAERGTVTISEVARELSIDAALAETLFSELERQGYLKSVGSDCNAYCGACSKSRACTFFKGLRVWTFTKRGAETARALSRNPGR